MPTEQEKDRYRQGPAREPRWTRGPTACSPAPTTSSAQVQGDACIKPDWPAEAFSDLDEDVRQPSARIKASPFTPHRDSVRGFVYDVKAGALREVTAGSADGSSRSGQGPEVRPWLPCRCTALNTRRRRLPRPPTSRA
jgi:hypothetical protein